MRETKVVVFGQSGMLGSMVMHRLSETPGFVVTGTTRNQLDAENLEKLDVQLAALPVCDFVVNCIGIIKPYCRDDDPDGVRRAIKVNAGFPHILERWAREHSVRVLQIATDCVYSGTRGFYKESDPHDAWDVYGKTKSLGEVHSPYVLNIRTSVIGPEIKGRLSLLEWVLSHPSGSILDGYAHHHWNGVTTLQYADLCAMIINEPAIFDDLVGTNPVHHFVPNRPINKRDLVALLSDVFECNHKVKTCVSQGMPIYRTLATEFNQLERIYSESNLTVAIQELRHYWDKHQSTIRWGSWKKR